MSSPDRPTSYALGHTPAELERLARQARLVDPITRRLFEGAGVGPGMRVLDVGCGAGDTSFLVASLVGPTGDVVGADRSVDALHTARARAASLGLQNVKFVDADPTAAALEGKFDAIVGRYVLMFQASPVALLQGLLRHAHAGTIVAFHEPSWAGIVATPPAPLYEESARWIVELLKRTGADDAMGLRLDATFRAAGLPAPAMTLEAGIGGAVEARAWIELFAEIVQTLAPGMEQHGIVRTADLDLPTLSARMVAEVERNGSVIVGRYEIGAWTRVPAGFPFATKGNPR